MALTVEQGFARFLERLMPLQSQRDASAKHRTTVERSLIDALDAKAFRYVGSIRNDTGVRNYSVVDVLASLPGKPDLSSTGLTLVKDALSASFPETTVRISRPAVVVEFAENTQTWKIIPGFRKSSGYTALYTIPGIGSDHWIESAPAEHITYVNEVNQHTRISGGAKQLSRLAKAWKYYNGVSVSSFYLEMRAAQYLSHCKTFDPINELTRFFEFLLQVNLAPMEDPMGLTSPFYACTTATHGENTLSMVHAAVLRAQKARDAHHNAKPVEAFQSLSRLFGGQFPGP
jgi:hypothetical protein